MPKKQGEESAFQKKRMNKSYILLQMYDRLRKGGRLRINECCGQYEISEVTFRRYIAFLRGYFNEMYGQEIIYNAADAEYKINM